MEGPTGGDNFCEEQAVNTTLAFIPFHVIVLPSQIQQGVTIMNDFHGLSPKNQ